MLGPGHTMWLRAVVRGWGAGVIRRVALAQGEGLGIVNLASAGVLCPSDMWARELKITRHTDVSQATRFDGDVQLLLSRMKMFWRRRIPERASVTATAVPAEWLAPDRDDLKIPN